jgi:hypothetical protein
VGWAGDAKRPVQAPARSLAVIAKWLDLHITWSICARARMPEAICQPIQAPPPETTPNQRDRRRSRAATRPRHAHGRLAGRGRALRRAAGWPLRAVPRRGRAPPGRSAHPPASGGCRSCCAPGTPRRAAAPRRPRAARPGGGAPRRRAESSPSWNKHAVLPHHCASRPPQASRDTRRPVDLQGSGMGGRGIAPSARPP